MRVKWIGLAFVVACLHEPARGQDAPNRSPELQVLDRYIGDWDVEVVTGTGEKSTVQERRVWSKQGTFVLSENLDVPTKKEAHFLLTYDAKNKHYRSCFINEEFTIPLVGTWDEKTQTMRWKSTDIAFKHDGTNRFVDRDHVEFRMTVTSPEGNIVFEMSGKQARRKK